MIDFTNLLMYWLQRIWNNWLESSNQNTISFQILQNELVVVNRKTYLEFKS